MAVVRNPNGGSFVCTLCGIVFKDKDLAMDKSLILTPTPGEWPAKPVMHERMCTAEPDPEVPQSAAAEQFDDFVKKVGESM